MPLPWRSAAVVVVVALGLSACGGDDDDPGAATASSARSSGSTTTSGADGPREPDDGPVLDEQILREGIAAVEDFFQRDGEVEAGLYRAMAERTCSEAVLGAAGGRRAEDTATAIVDGVPEGPSLRNFDASMILLAQYYLSRADCGVDVATARSIRAALAPLQNDAIREGR
jgi:hypothetical protein